jgi:WD40 repeat protein
MGPKVVNINFNPFPGLRPFAPDESELFFGRDGESEEVLGKLLKNRFVTVIGASGSGKSSLIYCGVLSKIRNLKRKDASAWRIISFRPGNDPFGNLADAISEEISDTGQKNIDRNTILAELQNNPEAITATVKKFVINSDEKVLIVIDQFEELFRYSTHDKADTFLPSAKKFVDFIVDAAGQSSEDVFTIVAMRSDYIGECSHYHEFTQLINNSNYLIPYMRRENYREAIEGPVKYAGVKIDPELVETLLSDIGERTDQLPVLQHALMRTWNHWQKLDEPDRPVSKSDYDSIGTMRDAMSLHANETFEELSHRSKEICEIMFKIITEKGPDNRGLRHPTSVKVVKSIAGCTSEELFEVAEKFRFPSRSFITPRQNVLLTDDSVIDLSHESLIRLWDRLRIWVDDEAASVKMYLRLSEASAMYQQGKTSLWRPPDLQLAINWRDQHKPTLAWAERYNPAYERAMVYLRTSEKVYLEEEQNKIRQQKRKMKRTRIISMILGVAAIISLGFMLFAFVKKIAADREKIYAEKQKATADSFAAVAFEQLTIADSNAATAGQKAEEARQQKEAADIKRSLAERNAAEALHRRNIAIEQSDSAQKASLRADENARVATELKNAAMRLRMLSVGKSMSLKSLQVQGQKDLQTLLAYQAYLFYKTNNGPENDADIYAGLYNVARQYGSPGYKSLKGHNGGIKSIAFVPGNNEFFTSGYDGQIIKWSLEGKEQSLQVIYSGNEIIEVLSVSPDASWLACGNANSSIKMIPLKGNNVGYEMTGHTGKITSLIFSFDGKHLYSASLDGKVLRWDLTARTSTNVNTGSVEITSIDISSNGNYLAGISRDGNVVVWNPENRSDNFRIETAGKNINVIRFNPENNLLAIGDVTGNVELWDINSHKKISEVKAHSAQVNDIQFNTTLKQMATAGNDKTLKIFNIKDPADLTEPPVTFTDDEGFVLVMKFSPDGKLIVSGAYEGSQNLISRASHVDNLVRDICNIVSRNMTQNEWNIYVGKDIPIEKTCQDKSYNIKVDAIK